MIGADMASKCENEKLDVRSETTLNNQALYLKQDSVSLWSNLKRRIKLV